MPQQNASARLRLAPDLNLSADAQWIDPGISHTDEELILDLRLNARF